jgi:hypothetical protein
VSFGQINGRREAIYVALAAAELCWVTPVFVNLTAGTTEHHPVLAGMGLLIIYLSHAYIYRALEAARLHVKMRQWVLLGVLLGQFLFIVKAHIYAEVPVTDLAWLIRPFIAFTEVMVRVPESLVVLVVLIFLWWRGINLAQRSLSTESVGFSFRWGIVVFVWLALAITLTTQRDISAFVVPYFFFGLAAQALARIDEVHQTRGTSPTRASPFWVAFTLFSVALLIGLGSILAAFFYGGGLAQVVRWFRPLLIVIQVIVAAFVLAIVYGLATILSAVPLDLTFLLDAMRQVVERLQSLVGIFERAPDTGNQGPGVMGHRSGRRDLADRRADGGLCAAPNLVPDLASALGGGGRRGAGLDAFAGEPGAEPARPPIRGVAAGRRDGGNARPPGIEPAVGPFHPPDLCQLGASCVPERLPSARRHYPLRVSASAIRGLPRI